MRRHHLHIGAGHPVFPEQFSTLIGEGVQVIGTAIGAGDRAAGGVNHAPRPGVIFIDHLPDRIFRDPSLHDKHITVDAPGFRQKRLNRMQQEQENARDQREQHTPARAGQAETLAAVDQPPQDFI